ncbi:Tudor domain [Popillia japonica]|uniref:Tudor domain n=1 Tax=Popillia japonica TaxID=7064 RepID=A0AAW1LQC3_POPJA
MRIVEMQNNRALVDLYDKQHYNVASLLLEKIASSTSTVSPLLIQDNHRIEQRKRSPPQTNQKDFRDNKPLRELNDRNRDNRQENWRQNSFSRTNDDNWNDQTQTEKEDRFQKTNNRNDETEWDNPETSENNRTYSTKPNGTIQKLPRIIELTRIKGGTISNEQTITTIGAGRITKIGTSMREQEAALTGETTLSKRRTASSEGTRRDGFERRDGSEKGDGFDRRGKRDGFEKRDDFGGRGDFHKRGDGGFGGKRDDFERKDGFKKFNRNQSGEDRKFDNYGKGSRNFDNRGGDEGFGKHKGRDFKKDGSEKSWSDTSEKSWKKGPPRGRGGDGGKFGSSRKGFTPPNNESLDTETWDTGNAPSIADDVTYDYAAETDQFEIYADLSGTNEAVSISWFYNPINFYCQLDKNKIEFKEMMEEIQSSYRNRTTAQLNPDAPAVVPFAEDGALYRAQIISSQFNQYHVRYVDYGNVATVNKVYQIEKKYMKLPAQAIPCGLGGIAPCGEDWPKPDAFSAYFDKENFDCQFVSFLEDRYCVALNSDGRSIADLLNEASLAISTQATTNIDINLLLNQQIMIVLRNVASLGDVTVEIESGVAVNTSMHNLATATETYEDNLKQWMGHYLIMYVDGVLEDRLEVTFYDLTGQKLQIITPDEGAYDTVEPLCPLPIYSNVIEGWVSHASAESIYIQPSKFADAITQLLESLYEHYGALAQEEPVTPEEGQMFAVLSSDGNWYRGNVTEIKDGAAVVTFVDYGNTELVPFENLRELSPQFYQPHMLAVEVTIPGDKEKYLEQEIAVSVVFGELGWEGEVVEGDRWEGEVVEGGKDGAPPEETEPAECPPGEIEVVESEIEVVAEEMTETPPIGFHVVISQNSVGKGRS